MSDPGNRDRQVANPDTPAADVNTAAVLMRALHARCPQCGRGKIFSGWNRLVDQCEFCGCELERRGGGSWFFTYMSTAFLTGIIVVFMLFVRLPSLIIQIAVIVAAWFLIIVLTLPIRKSIGVAIDYLVDLRSR